MLDLRPALSLGLVALWGLCAPQVQAQTQAETPLPVTAVTLERAVQMQSLSLTGSVAAQETIPVAFNSAGRIMQILPQLGDNVAGGEVIAMLEPTQAAQMLRAAAAQLASAEAAVLQSEQNYQRARDLLARGAGRQAERDAAEQSWLAASAQRDEAQAGLAKAQQALDDTTLRAPIGGIVIARDAEEGQIAAAGQPVVTIAAAGAREAAFAIPAVPLDTPLMGQSVTVTLLDDPSQSVTGVIREVAPMTNSATGTLSLRVTLPDTLPDSSPDSSQDSSAASLPDAASAFGLGSAVTASFTLPQGMGFAIPAAALTTQDNAPAVWVIDPQSLRVALRPVTVSRFTSTQVEIGAGVASGEQVVVAGAHLLYPDRLVAPQEVLP